MGSIHLRHLFAKLSAIATHDSHYSSCLGHLGQYHGQGKYIQRNIVGVIVGDITLNIANVNSALKAEM
jgi:hypothetical protein